jgi:hypothetical protein
MIRGQSTKENQIKKRMCFPQFNGSKFSLSGNLGMLNLLKTDVKEQFIINYFINKLSNI